MDLTPKPMAFILYPTFKHLAHGRRPSERTKMGKCECRVVCGEGKGNPLHILHILAWRIPWAKEHGKL